MDISQGYAFFAYPWSVSRNRNRTPEGVSRIPRTPYRVPMLIGNLFQGYAKNAYPSLISHHASGVSAGSI